MQTVAKIQFRSVSYDVGSTVILTGIDLEIVEGETVVLLGESGCGKTTTLKMINRLIEPTCGEVLVEGKPTTEWNAIDLRRRTGYVLQESGLLPHFSVERNVGLVPVLLEWDEARKRSRTNEMLELVGLPPAKFASRFPHELSGGQRQRVGLARALAADPDILLMDEPFGAVDPIARRELRAELRRIHAGTGKTVLLVTHDPGEALELATHLAVLRDGRVVASGSALELLAAPVDGFVRELIGGNDLGLRRLGLLPVCAAIDPEPPPPG